MISEYHGKPHTNLISQSMIRKIRGNMENGSKIGNPYQFLDTIAFSQKTSSSFSFYTSLRCRRKIKSLYEDHLSWISLTFSFQNGIEKKKNLFLFFIKMSCRTKMEVNDRFFQLQLFQSSKGKPIKYQFGAFVTS